MILVNIIHMIPVTFSDHIVLIHSRTEIFQSISCWTLITKWRSAIFIYSTEINLNLNVKILWAAVIVSDRVRIAVLIQTDMKLQNILWANIHQLWLLVFGNTTRFQSNIQSFWILIHAFASEMMRFRIVLKALLHEFKRTVISCHSMYLFQHGL